MGAIVASFSMSVDGFVADPDSQVTEGLEAALNVAQEIAGDSGVAVTWSRSCSAPASATSTGWTR